MSDSHIIIETIKSNWIQLGVFGMGLLGYFIGYQSRKDTHSIAKAQKFNIDVDTLNDSFDLSQKLLKSLREQLDNTQEMLDKANKAYKLLELELINAREINKLHELKIAALKKENRELLLEINTCPMECNFKKKIIKTTTDGTYN